MNLGAPPRQWERSRRRRAKGINHGKKKIVEDSQKEIKEQMNRNRGKWEGDGRCCQFSHRF